ncbi:MAG: type III-B CRISPR module RAMP protein Cmr6 [Bacteroidales bacterium]
MSWKSQDAPNVGLIFYKERYIGEQCNINNRDEIEFTQKNNFKNKNKKIYLLEANTYKTIDIETKHQFILKTTYPGLLVGSGYPHDTNTEGDFAIGFYFDYTTGLPVIPGSSVKGICRSLFELDQRPTKNNETEKYSGLMSLEAIKFILNEMKFTPNDNLNNQVKLFLLEHLNKELGSLTNNAQEKHKESEFLKQMVVDLFGDQDHPGEDIFLDAIIDIEKTGKKKFLGDDYITPHPSPIRNPIPIQFLKVLPNVWFKFRFILTETKINIKGQEMTLKPEFKLKFYKQILLTQGVGAKTSVGYGRLEEEKSPSQEKRQNNDRNVQQTDNQQNQGQIQQAPKQENTNLNIINKSIDKLKNGDELIIEFKIEKLNSCYFIAKDQSSAQKITIEANLTGNKPAESGFYKAEIATIEGKGEKRKFIIRIKNLKKIN